MIDHWVTPRNSSITKVTESQKMWSALHVATQAGNTALMGKLLDHKADVNCRAGGGQAMYNMNMSSATAAFRQQISPLQMAARKPCLPAAKLLIERGGTVAGVNFEVPNGAEGDLVAGLLQTHGSTPVKRVDGPQRTSFSARDPSKIKYDF